MLIEHENPILGKSLSFHSEFPFPLSGLYRIFGDNLICFWRVLKQGSTNFSSIFFSFGVILGVKEGNFLIFNKIEQLIFPF